MDPSLDNPTILGDVCVCQLVCHEDAVHLHLAELSNACGKLYIKKSLLLLYFPPDYNLYSNALSPGSDGQTS